MKLLIYSHFFAPSVGGVETIVLSLARGLATFKTADGTTQFEVTVVTQTPVGNFDDASLPFRVIRQPDLGGLWRLIRSSDVVHVAGPAFSPIFLARTAGKPVVVEHHGFQTICPNGQLLVEPSGTPCPGHFMAGRHSKCLRCNSQQGWLVSWKLWLLTFVRRFLCACASANITPTQWLGSLLHLPRITAIPHGLPDIPPPPKKIAQANAPVIAFQGRLVTTKGVRLLLEAASILRSQNRGFQLLIIGDGPERSSLEKLAQATNLASQVRFAGRLVPSDLDVALASASIIVVPSLGGEVFGLVVAENMQRGFPVIASDLGAFTEVLGDAGLTFRTGDAADLAAKLAQLLDDSSLATRLGNLARQRVEHIYNLHHMLESHAAIYRRFG